jgi:hypothetical protein
MQSKLPRHGLSRILQNIPALVQDVTGETEKGTGKKYRVKRHQLRTREINLSNTPYCLHMMEVNSAGWWIGMPRAGAVIIVVEIENERNNCEAENDQKQHYWFLERRLHTFGSNEK